MVFHIDVVIIQTGNICCSSCQWLLAGENAPKGLALSVDLKGDGQAQTQTASQAEQITLGKEVAEIPLSKQSAIQEKASLSLTIPSNVQQPRLNART
jgi:hypothetical protein